MSVSMPLARQESDYNIMDSDSIRGGEVESTRKSFDRMSGNSSEQKTGAESREEYLSVQASEYSTNNHNQVLSSLASSRAGGMTH